MEERDLGLVLAYADDLAVVTRNRESLQVAMGRWEEILRRAGMRINKGKTEVMKITRLQEDLQIIIDSVAIKQVTTFKYLGRRLVQRVR